jgi:hypothetical protein
MIRITLIQTQPFHKLRLRLALGKRFDFRRHGGVLTLHALASRSSAKWREDLQKKEYVGTRRYHYHA